MPGWLGLAEVYKNWWQVEANSSWKLETKGILMHYMY